MRARQIAVLTTAFFLACGREEAADKAVAEQSERRDGRQSAVANLTVPQSRAASAAVAFEAAPVAPPPPPSAARPPEEQLPGSIAPSMVIRTGDARVKVESVDSAIVRVHELARRLGGYVANSSIQGGEKELRQAMLELKIPANRFDDAQAGLAALGTVEYVNVNAHDVGEEFVDITARVDNAKRLEQRLVGLLATRTGRLEEVLSVERELARVRETIERYEGRLRYLRTRVDVSTLTITVHESEPIVGGLGTGNRIVDAFKNAWRNFVEFVADGIEALGVLLPLGIIAFFVGRWVWRRRPRRVDAPQPPAES